MQYQKRRKEYATKTEIKREFKDGEMIYKETVIEKNIEAPMSITFPKNAKAFASPKIENNTDYNFQKSAKEIQERYNTEKQSDSSQNKLKLYTSKRKQYKNSQINNSPENPQIQKDEYEFNSYNFIRNRSPGNSFQNTSSVNEKENKFYSNFTSGRMKHTFSLNSGSPINKSCYENDINKNYTSSFQQSMIPLNKMSPNRGYDENNSTFEPKKIYKTNTTRRYIGVNNEEYLDPNSLGVNNRIINSPNIQNYKNNNPVKNNLSYRELKKIARRFNKVYDPNKNEKGILIRKSMVTLPGASDEIFNNRYRVLSKMNKLSHILLAKQKNEEEEDEEENDRSNSRSYNKNTEKNSVDKQLLKNSQGRSLSKNRKKGGKKLLYVSLAIMSSKRSNTEDRTILRKMRLEKGGVVDLAQEKINKNKFKIKKVKRISGISKNAMLNPKYREKAAKIIQNWWKDLKELYNDRLKKIIFIQSVWKGRWVRKNIYDLLYLNYLYLSFCERIQKVLIEKMMKYALNKLIQNQKKKQSLDKNKLKNVVLKCDKKRIKILEKAWNKWVLCIRTENLKNKKGNTLLQIRADKENKLGLLRTAFTIWKYKIKMEDIKNQYDNSKTEVIKYNKIITVEEKNNDGSIFNNKNNLNKVKGLFKIIDNINIIHKKQSLKDTEPKLKKYLIKKMKKEKLIKIIENKSIQKNKILRKYLHIWLKNTIYSKNETYSEEHNNQLLLMKAKMFSSIVDNFSKKHKKNILRKYFYKYYKNTINLSKKLNDLNPLSERQTNSSRDIQRPSNEYTTLARKLHKAGFNKYENAFNKYGNIKRFGFNNISDNLEACKILERYCWRNTVQYPLNCMKNKLIQNSTKESLLKIIKISEKFRKSLIKKKIHQWRNKVFKKINNDLLLKLLLKTIKIITDNMTKKLLYKKLLQWQKNVHMLNNTNDIFKKSKDTYDFIDHIKKYTIKKYGNFFYDKIKKAKKQSTSRQALKKIIIKVNIKNRNNLLKNSFNKWKKLITDYAMGKLKGKLLLTLYGKYKTNKMKDVLEKAFNKWKNNTIFLDQIKIKVSHETTKVLKEHNLNETKIILLKAVFRNLDRKNNLKKLFKYFNIWKKSFNLTKGMLSSAKTHMLKHNINKNGDLLLKKMMVKYHKNRKNQLLRRFIIKRAKNENLLLLKFLFRWKNRMYAIKASGAHKPFLYKLLAILLIKNDKENLQRAFTKWKYCFSKNKSKMPYIIAIKNLKNVFVRKPFKKFIKTMKYNDTKKLKPKGEILIKILTKICEKNPFDDFIKKMRLKIRVNKLRNVQPKVHDKLRKYLLKKYIEKWNNNVKEDKDKKMKLISNWIKNKVENEKDKKNKRKKELLKKFILALIKDNKYKLLYAFKLWNRITHLTSDDFNSRIIQKFCRQGLKKINKKSDENKQKIKKLLLELSRKKFLKDINKVFNKNLNNLINKGKKDDAIKKKLKIILISKSKRDLKNKLKDIFNKWKNINKNYLLKIAKIQSAYRDFKNKKKLNNLKKLDEILFKLVIKRSDNSKNKLRKALIEWLLISRKEMYNENSTAIQNFVKTRIRNRRFQNRVNFFKDLAKKKFLNVLQNAYKLNKLKNALRKKVPKTFFDNLRNTNKLYKIKIVLLKVFHHLDDNLKKLLLKHYFNKWRILVIKQNNNAKKIQNALRNHLLKNQNYIEELKKKKLLNIITKINLNNIMRYKFWIWNRKVQILKCNDNATIIQNFCKIFKRRLRNNKNEKNKKAYNNLCNVLMKIRVKPNDFLKRLKKIKGMHLFKKIGDDLENKRKKILRNTYDKVKDYSKLKKLLILIYIPDKIKKRLMKFYFEKFVNNVLHRKNINDSLKNIFNNKDKKLKNKLEAAFEKWLYIAMKIKQIEKSNIIQKFCQIRLKQARYGKLWRKFADLLRKKNRKKDLKDLLKKLKILLGLKKIRNVLRTNPRKNVFNNLRKKNHYKIFIYKTTKVIDDLNNRNNKNKLRRYFLRWKNNAKKSNSKVDALKNMMNTLGLHNTKNSAKIMYNLLILKKLIHDIPKLRKYYFLKRLSSFSKHNDGYKKLSNDLVNTRDDLLLKKRSPVINKILRLYAYKVISNLFDEINKRRRNKMRPIFKNFIRTLYNIKTKTTNDYNYNTELKGTVKPNVLKGFKLKINKKKSLFDNNEDNKKIIYLRLTPFLINYLNKKILNRKKIGLEKIKSKSRAEKFCQLYKKWALFTEIPDKEDLIDNLKYDIYKRIKKVSSADKLLYLIRKKIIKKITEVAKVTGKDNRVLQLVKLTMLHKNIARDRWLLKLIRKWRFITFVRIMTTRKMELMYKDLHVTYLEMADSILNEENKMKDLPDYSDKNIFNIKDPYLLQGAKLYKNVKKQYVFEPPDGENEKLMKIMYEYDVYDKIKEIRRRTNQEFIEYKNSEDAKFGNEGGYKFSISGGYGNDERNVKYEMNYGYDQELLNPYSNQFKRNSIKNVSKKKNDKDKKSK